jgi:hypothetical protein
VATRPMGSGPTGAPWTVAVTESKKVEPDPIE